MHVSIIDHALSLAGVHELKGKNIPRVHIPDSRDWGLGACPQKTFLQPNCLQRWKMPLYKKGEMERVQYEGQFLPLLPLSVGAPECSFLSNHPFYLLLQPHQHSFPFPLKVLVLTLSLKHCFEKVSFDGRKKFLS